MNPSGVLFLESLDLVELFCSNGMSVQDRSEKASEYKKNDYVFSPNQSADNIYVIIEGSVKIGSFSDSGVEVTKNILTTGDIFGELALTGESKHSDFAQVLDDHTQICSMKVHVMTELMDSNEALKAKIFGLIGKRVRKLEKRIASMVHKDARTRVVDFVREMALDKGKKVGYETMVKNYLTHQDIANLTGTSRQTVTTVLNELKQANLINFNRRQILVRDMDNLR